MDVYNRLSNQLLRERGAPHPFHSLTQNELVDLPVLEVLLEDEGAHVRVEVEHAGAVDVQDGVEAVPVPVEEELCLYQVTSSNTAISKINIHIEGIWILYYTWVKSMLRLF